MFLRNENILQLTMTNLIKPRLFMKKKFIPLGAGILIAIAAMLPEQSFAQDAKNKSESAVFKDSIVADKKEEKNRNVMLNAGSASAPRQINIGIPAGGDLLILENDLPTIFTFYPQIPTSVWKYDSNIGKIGLLSLAEGALTFGKVGFCVNTYDREAGSKFKGYFQTYTSNFGSLIYSGNISGPIGEKGWGYVLGMHETYDRSSGINRMYTPWNERMEMFKAGISKKYKNGSVKLLYKYSEQSSQLSSNQPVVYEGKGKFTQYPGFRLGEDSYTVGNGKLSYADADTGELIKYNLGDDKYNKNISSAIYLTGDHKFGNGYKLTYSSMYMHSNSPFIVQFPLSLGTSEATETSGYQLNGEPYTGGVQMTLTQMVEPTTIDQSLSRIELTKKVKSHNLRLGLTEQYYATGIQKQNGALYYHTIEANPQLLKAFNGFVETIPMPGIIGKLRSNKTALYFSDDFTVGPRFDFTLGARIEKQDDKETHDQYVNQFVMGRELMTREFKNNWNHVAVGSFVAKVTNNFGFLGDVTYNDFYNRFWDYPADQKDDLGQPVADAQTTVPLSTQIKVLFLGAGIYYNHGDEFSIVSKVTRSSKLNNTTSLDLFNPEDSSQKTTVNPLFYDITTLGWTTDIMASPFKNFNIHYLITLQNPQYKNYSATAFGNTYSYNNTVPGLSKVLMEIDPSYKMGDVRLWASLRYYGKQYGNLTNAIYYNSWWENFAGVDYRLSRNIDFKLQLTNFLNQKGISGTLQGADQITTATEPDYIGKVVTAGSIRPRTLELTVTFKL